MFVRELMLHMKSLFWCLKKDRERYNIKLIVDCLNAGHVPESIQGTHLGQNLNYLIRELSQRGGVRPLLSALRRISNSKTRMKISSGNIELGQYLKTTKQVGEIPIGSYGVVTFLQKSIKGLFFVEDNSKSELISRDVSEHQVRVICGTSI